MHEQTSKSKPAYVHINVIFILVIVLHVLATYLLKVFLKLFFFFADIMPRTYVPKKVKRYSKLDLLAALASVDRGSQTVRSAAKKYGIPFETLRYRVVNPLTKETAGRNTNLTQEEEEDIARAIAYFSEYGRPVGRLELQRIVASYLLHVGRDTSFLEGIPGLDWVSFTVIYLLLVAKLLYNSNCLS